MSQLCRTINKYIKVYYERMKDRVRSAEDVRLINKVYFSFATTENPDFTFMGYSKERFVANRNQMAREVLEHDGEKKLLRTAQALALSSRIQRPQYFPQVKNLS